MSNLYLKLLYDLSKIEMEYPSSQELVDGLEVLLKDFFGILKIDFLTFDYSTSTFRDLVKDWVYIEDDNIQKVVFSVYKALSDNNGKFVYNGKLFGYDSSDAEIEEMKSLSSDEINIVYFPIFSTNRTFGLIQVYFQDLKEDLEINHDFLKVIEILIYQISVSIYNNVVKGHLTTSLDFYDTMKNIAKIIESQYELEYIIPQIGEMVDRFIASHLIYVFLKKEGEFKLIWPANCNNNEIYNMLSKINGPDNILLSPDKRIGIFPIQGEGQQLGALVAFSTIGKLGANEIEYLVELTKQSGITIHRANVYSEVLKHATLDALTGLNNRRQFEIRLKQETSQAVRKKTNLCCIMLDIDYFKKVNDTYGHAAGDCVLKGVAEIVTNTLREYDIACRYGGEEFFILLPLTTLDEAISVAQRLRKNIQAANIDITAAKLKGISSLQVTVSVGVNQYNPETTPEEFYHGADKALYESKINGRNRVTVYTPAMDKT